MVSAHQISRSLLWAVAALFAFGGCDGCAGCGSEILARLSEANGPVTRDFAASQGQWSQAAVGSEFKLGDAVRTAADADAVVSLSEGGGLRLEANTIVRFLDHAPDDDSARVEVEMGAAQVEAGEAELSVVAGSAGFARVAAGSRVRVTASDEGIQLQVEFGSAEIERTGQEVLNLHPGEFHLFSLEMGLPVFETDGDGGADAGPDATPDAEVDAEIEVAQLGVRITGRVDVQNAEGEWERAPRGAETLPVGTRVRVARRGRLTVSRGAETATLRGSGEATIGAGGTLMSISGGTVNANATSADITIGVPGGTILSRSGGGGSRVDIRMQRSSAVVEARTGSAQLQGTSDSHLLRFGESGTLRADGTVDASNRAPGRAHIALSAGSSAILHDPSAPVAVRIRFGGQCPGEGVVEVSRGRSFRRPNMRSFGAGSANILVPPGSNRYRVRCVTDGTPTGGAVAEGSINVQRDSGRARLPVRPSRVPIDTDGRRYTVLYQNRLPIVMIRWPDAPQSGGYVFNFRPASGSPIRAETGSPRYQLESGQVSEGSHQVWFDAPGGSPAQSPRTTLTVRYDLAASAVFLREPSGSTVSAGTVRISGQALDGWSVSVNGTDLPLDNAYRFAGSASTPSDVDALAIRLVHPRHGVHYYLRRINR